jgi:hypothetical protein
MGNAHSASEERQQTRVSKPRTYTTDRAIAARSPLKTDFGSTVTTAYPYSPSSPSENTGSAPNSPTKARGNDRLSQQDLRQAVRTQLLAPSNSGFSEEDEDERLGVMAATVARSLSHSGKHGHVPSAKSSLTKLNSASSQLSLGTERSVDLETAVALLHELRKTASPDDLVALRMYAAHVDLTSTDNFQIKHYYQLDLPTSTPRSLAKLQRKQRRRPWVLPLQL